MNKLIEITLLLLIIILFSYLIGKFFAKGLLKEIDLYFGKKFVDYVNNKTKKEKDDNKEKESK
jgi:hypothetical protein